MPTVLGELRCGHITSVSSGIGWLAWVVLEKCLAVVPCATADEESGSSLKFESCVGQHYVLFSTKKICFENLFFQISPCIKKIAFRKLNPSLILDVTDALYSVYTPLRGCGWTCWVRLYSPHSKFLQKKIQTSFRTTSSRVPSCTQSCLWIGTPQEIPHGARLWWLSFCF